MHHPSYSAIGAQYGFPFYCYDEAEVAERLVALKGAFPDFGILYSVKTNPHPGILGAMAAQGAGADAASSFEVTKALDAGFGPDSIFYSAPGKTGQQIADALGRCVITADSWSELHRLERMAGEKGLSAAGPVPVGIRINPDMAYGAGEFPFLAKGTSMKFGVDEESLEANRDFLASLRHVRIAGIHVFLRSQVLDHTSLAACFEGIFTLALRCRENFGWNLSFCNFGGGIGIGPGDGYPDADVDALGKSVRRMAALYAPRLPGCSLLMESGRYLVGRAGTFVCRIEDIKVSRGKTYVIAPGALSGFLRPSVMHLISGVAGREAGPFEPLYSNPNAHQVALPEKTDGALRRVTVCGNLCTALDVVAVDVDLPDPQIGDILTISNAGAYAASLSPFAFASFPRPAEVYRAKDGSIRTC